MQSMTARKFKKVAISGLVIILGLFYYVLARFWLAPPCLFRLVTGLKCPGCGVTHMILGLTQLDVRLAFYSNPVLFLFQPVIYYFIGKNYVCWFNDRKCTWNTVENVLLYGMIFLLLIFAIVRNLV